tara:strand:+ start:3533 stop:4006 length:474 start_codon:yes stop_codon:yes gene_type:complete
MKLTCETRQLQTPQTTSNGKVRTNVINQPIYTVYLKLTPYQLAEVKQHMSRYITIISEFTDTEFAMITDHIDLNAKTQIDNEPTAYNYLERLQMVLDRLDKTDDMTTGIIDMYNNVVCKTLRVLNFDVTTIKKARVEIEDPVLSLMRGKLNPDLFAD